MKKNMPAPCNECPFTKAIKPGALGGSKPEVYIGQAYAPFILPCHKACDFTDPDWKAKSMDTPQCAGAAVFRTHIGVAEHLPDAIHKLPRNPAVFSGPVDFLAHHKRISYGQALQQLAARGPLQLARDQLDRIDNITFNTNRREQ